MSVYAHVHVHKKVLHVIFVVVGMRTFARIRTKTSNHSTCLHTHINLYKCLHTHTHTHTHTHGFKKVKPTSRIATCSANGVHFSKYDHTRRPFELSKISDVAKQYMRIVI